MRGNSKRSFDVKIEVFCEAIIRFVQNNTEEECALIVPMLREYGFSYKEIAEIFLAAKKERNG